MSVGSEVDPATPISQRIDLLHAALRGYIRKLEAAKVHKSVTNEQYLKQHACIKHVKMLHILEFSKDADLDLGKLHDIKAVFEASWLPPAIGLVEDEFRTIVAPILHPGYPSSVDSWYSAIDYDSSGYVDWPKLSLYLMTPLWTPGVEAGLDVAMLRVSSKSGALSAAMNEEKQYATLPFGYDQAPSGYRIDKLVFHSAHDSYLACCSDNNVREFSAETLRCIGMPHYGDGSSSVDLKVSSEHETLYVAQRSGYIFVYDTTGEMCRTGNLIRAMRVTPSNHGISVPLTVKKTLPYDPLRMRHFSTGVAGKKPTTVPLHVDLLICGTRSLCSCQARIPPVPPSHNGKHCSCRKYDFAQNHQIQCIEPSRGLWPSFLNRDPYVFVGLEGGYVALYPTDLSHSRPSDSAQPPIAAWRPHTDWVTKIMVTTHHRELYGWLSSSQDASIQLMDLEKQTSKVTIVDEFEAGAEGGWLNGKRPVLSFDVSRAMPIIASCGHMRVVNIWSPLMRRKISSFMDNKAAVIDVCFNDELYHLVSLGSDRTIRIWDIRTMRPMQIITDKERLKCDDPLSAIIVDTKRHAIVAAASGPYVWHDSKELRRRETGGVWFSGYQGHSEPVREVHVSVSNEHLVSSDGREIRVWNSQGEFLRAFTISSRTTAITFDSRARQLFVGTEAGNVEVWSHFNAKRLRILAGKREVTAILHLGLQPDDTIIHSMLVAAGGGLVKFYSDKTVPVVNSSGVPQVDSSYLIDPLGISPSNSETTATITSLAFLAGAKLIVVGLSRGIVVLCSLYTQTGPQATAQFSWKLPSATRFLASQNAPLCSPTEHQSSERAHSLWKKVVHTVNSKERRLGAAGFTQFRHTVQQVLNLRIDTLFVITHSFLLGLCGNGDAVIWSGIGSSPETTELEQIACFPASSQLGEATNAVLDDATLELCVIDTQGVISVFALSALARYCRKTSMLTQEGRPVSREAGEYHNDIGIRLISCCSCDLPPVNAMSIVRSTAEDGKQRSLLVVGCENCSVILIDFIEKSLLRVLGASQTAPKPLQCQKRDHRFNPTFTLRSASSSPTSSVARSPGRAVSFTPAQLAQSHWRFSGVFHPQWSGSKSNEDRLKWMSRRFPHLRDAKARQAIHSRSSRGGGGEELSQTAAAVISHVNANRERRAQTALSTGYERLKLQDISDVVAWRKKSVLSAVEMGRLKR